MDGYVEATARCFAFAREMQDRHALHMREYSPGGGWGIAYTGDQHPIIPAQAMRRVKEMVLDEAEQQGLAPPHIVVEPGRSIVGPAGVALYTVGAVKVVPGLRTFVSVDGGMADNIRPVTYGSRYEALLANRANDASDGPVTLAGKYCESGDLLIRDIPLPAPRSGDLVAIPASGAYNLPMSSNYNMAYRPAVVVVHDGEARLVRRRETIDDLLAAEL
jgi:diaminopimelate decarboxylase